MYLLLNTEFREQNKMNKIKGNMNFSPSSGSHRTLPMFFFTIFLLVLSCTVRTQSQHLTMTSGHAYLYYGLWNMMFFQLDFHEIFREGRDRTSRPFLKVLIFLYLYTRSCTVRVSLFYSLKESKILIINKSVWTGHWDAFLHSDRMIVSREIIATLHYFRILLSPLILP